MPYAKFYLRNALELVETVYNEQRASGVTFYFTSSRTLSSSLEGSKNIIASTTVNALHTEAAGECTVSKLCRRFIVPTWKSVGRMLQTVKFSYLTEWYTNNETEFVHINFHNIQELYD